MITTDTNHSLDFIATPVNVSVATSLLYIRMSHFLKSKITSCTAITIAYMHKSLCLRRYCLASFVVGQLV